MNKNLNYFKEQFESIWGEVITDTKNELKNSDIVGRKIRYQDENYEGVTDFYTKWNETWREFLKQNSDFNKLDEEVQYEIEDSDWIKKEFEKYL